MASIEYSVLIINRNYEDETDQGKEITAKLIFYGPKKDREEIHVGNSIEVWLKAVEYLNILGESQWEIVGCSTGIGFQMWTLKKTNN